MNSPSSNAEVELMTRVASLYYLEDATQAEIGNMLGMSRLKVGRLLKRARDERIVEIAIRTHPALRIELESELANRFSLGQAILVAEQGSEASQRQLVGRAAAEHLARSLRDGVTVAVGMGRNVNAVAEQLTAAPARRGCTFVCAIGGSPQVSAPVNPNDICRRLAEQFQGHAETLFAPAYAESAAVRESFLQHSDIREALARARAADIALVGVGDARNDSAVVQMGCFSGNEMARLRQGGAVGDILGSFFDINGTPVSQGMGNRVVGLLAEDLRTIPQVIAIVTEPDKGTAALGALRTGIIDVLVTTVGIARTALSAASGTDASEFAGQA